jgi:hypothetical protein
MGDAGGDGDLTVGAANKPGPSQQCEENLQTCRLKGAIASGDVLLTLWTLPLDENQEGRPVQKGVTGSIDELDPSGPQGVSQRRRHMVRHEKRVSLVGRKLMGDGPQGCGTQAAPDLDDVADVASSKSKIDIGVSPVGTVPDLLPQNAKAQPKGPHRLEGLGKKALLGLGDLVH